MSNEKSNMQMAERMRAKTKQALQKSSIRVFESVVNQLVDEEVEKRKSMIIKALEKYDIKKTEIEKVKADHVLYQVDDKSGDPNGIKTPASYSPDQYKKWSSLHSEIKEIREAINVALDEESPDFSKLKKITSG